MILIVQLLQSIKAWREVNLKNPGFAQLTLGQALFELQRFDEAKEVFTEAEEVKKILLKSRQKLG